MSIKNNLYSFFRLTGISLALLSTFVFSEVSFAGSKYSEQGDLLSKALYKELIQQEICNDNQMCWDRLQMFREDGKRIYLNMYNQADTKLTSIVAAFFIENGLKITKGMPITLKVFSAPKTEHMGLKSLFMKNEEILKLELNK